MISTTLGILGLGGQELILIALALLLLFGGKKIPELMRGLGKGIREFKTAQNEDDKTVSTKEKVEEEQK
ncbi:Sec-independent protein translocase subunit TatA/TatB [Albibacterium profundi]|uniref:Sec-independent protein translocase protein TatA n=1 Tax=Albibacterium profundi TaxID=3134906 RepID=A0ABV5CDG1_9SPHI